MTWLIISALAFSIFLIAVKWIIFTKAGEPGWASLVPIYDVCVFLKIAGKPMWWVLILWIPILGQILAILALIGLANKFGKGGGFVVGLIFLPIIFYPILAFGDAEYQP